MNEQRRMENVLVIGYGNPLRGDDGLGWHAAERLAAVCDRDIDIRAVHQLTPELADSLSRADFAIFIDAACDQSEGAVVFRRIEPDRSPSGAFSHQLTPEVLLGFTEKLYGRAPGAALFSVGGSRFECGEKLSTVVQSALPDLLAQVQSMLSAPRGTGAAIHIHETRDSHEETEETRR